MNTTFKFGDKVALKRSPNTCGIVARIYIDKVTVLWEDEYYGMSTDPIEEFIHYIDTNTSNIEKVMDALGIKKDVPIDVYRTDSDNKLIECPYIFDGNELVNVDRESRACVLNYIIFGYCYFKPHLSSTPFPQNCDTYYYVHADGSIGEEVWTNLTSDYALKLMGNVFKTEVEAKCHVSEVLAKYRGVM